MQMFLFAKKFLIMHIFGIFMSAVFYYVTQFAKIRTFSQMSLQKGEKHIGKEKPKSTVEFCREVLL